MAERQDSNLSADAKRKRSSQRPQARRKQQRKASQFDKRRRLDVANPERKKTRQARVPLVGTMASLASSMAGMLDKRISFRLVIIFTGIMLAADRRVAAAWFAAAGVQDDWDRFSEGLISFGKSTRSMTLPLLIAVVPKSENGPNVC